MPTEPGPSYISEGGSADGNPFAPQGQPATQFPLLSRSLALRGANSPGALALRAQHQQDQEYLAGENFDLRAQKLELDKVKEGVDIQKERTRIADSMELQRQTSKAFTEISALKHDDPDYQEKVLKIGADYPAAMKDKTIQSSIAFRDHQFITAQEAQGHLAAMAQQQTDALARENNEEANREKFLGMEQTDIMARKAGMSDQVREKYVDHIRDTAIAQAEFNDETDPEKKKVKQQDLTAFQVVTDAYKTQFPGLSTPSTAGTPSEGTAPAGGAAPAMTDDDKAALQWATANPSDPRAAQIRALHGQ